MAELTVAIIAAEDDQRTVLQMQVESTGMAREVHTFSRFPDGAAETLRRIQEAMADVIIVDISRQNVAAAIHTVELLHLEIPKATVFATGDSQPQAIIAAMRAGAREFLERPVSQTSLLEAFVRLTSSRKRSKGADEQGKIFTVVNAKGGSGSTTVAVNMAVALRSPQGEVALVDLASLGHAALHLNVKPQFTIADAIRNSRRLDESLLQGYMTSCRDGLYLLAGVTQAFTEDTAAASIAGIFELLVARFRYVVVDASSRLDQTMKTVCDLSQAVMLVTLMDVTSLWSAVKIRDFLIDGPAGNNLSLVLNRFRKVPGLSESEIEATTQMKITCKIPNQYAAVSSAINHGTPVVEQNHSEIARSFVSLAGVLTQQATPEKPKKQVTSMFGWA
ncbi:MAG TPA: AAA family ATPase [Terriglobales bacterium]|nr:AAA family ATPase [Terriglobales bacterium]